MIKKKRRALKYTYTVFSFFFLVVNNKDAPKKRNKTTTKKNNSNDFKNERLQIVVIVVVGKHKRINTYGVPHKAITKKTTTSKSYVKFFTFEYI